MARRHRLRSGALVAVGMGAANVMSLVLITALGRVLDPDGFGEISALLAVIGVCQVAGTAVQLVIGRQAAAPNAHERVDRTSVLVVAGGLAVAVLLVSPVLGWWLSVSSALSLVGVTVTVFGTTVLAGQLGACAGRSAFGSVAVGYALLGGSRLFVAAVMVVSDGGVAVAMLTLAASTTAAVIAFSRFPATRLNAGGGLALGGLAGAAWASGGFLALTSLDVLIARAFLSEHASGIYAAGSLFTKAGLWGPSFVGILLLAELARGRGGRVLREGVLLVTTLGLVIVGVAAVLGDRILRWLLGPGFGEAGELAGVFAALGVALALLNLLLTAGVAQRQRAVANAAWGAVALELLLVPIGASRSLAGAVIAALAAVATAAVVGTLVALRPAGSQALRR